MLGDSVVGGRAAFGRVVGEGGSAATGSDALWIVDGEGAGRWRMSRAVVADRMAIEIVNSADRAKLRAREVGGGLEIVAGASPCGTGRVCGSSGGGRLE